MIIPINKVINNINFDCIKLYNLIYNMYVTITIMIFAITGFIKNLLILKLIPIFLLNDMKHIIKETKCDNIDEIIAPITPMIGINTMLKINLIIAPIANAITGTFNFPNPCNAPFIVCINTTNIIVQDAKESICAPEEALGNNKSNICFENMHIHKLQGIPINIVTNIENSILLFAIFISLFATAAEIVGTNAVEKAILNEKGSVINVSTFPFSIPYISVAFSSPIVLLKILTTVKASIVLLSTENNAHNAIGIDTHSILLTIFITLSLLCIFDEIISCQTSFFLFIKNLYKYTKLVNVASVVASAAAPAINTVLLLEIDEICSTINIVSKVLN